MADYDVWQGGGGGSTRAGRVEGRVSGIEQHTNTDKGVLIYYSLLI